MSFWKCFLGVDRDVGSARPVTYYYFLLVNFENIFRD